MPKWNPKKFPGGNFCGKVQVDFKNQNGDAKSQDSLKKNNGGQLRL